MSTDGLEIALVETIKSEELRDIASDNLEIILDLVLNDGPVKDVPILGTLINIIGAYKNIRDMLFARKIGKFLFELKGCSQPKRKELVLRLGITRGSEKNIGETILMLLERLDDIEKPTIIGRLFVLCAEGSINESILFRLCNTVERTYIGDLLALRKIGSSVGFTEEERGAFISVGLMLPKLKA